MRFNPKTIHFGGHETFQLRYSWLTKGYRYVSADSDFFKKEDFHQTLGVGMNMGLSIKFWLKSFQIVDHKSFKVTKVGQKIFDEKKGIDPYLEDDSTIWLLHWLLCSNPRATLFYYFFNNFHKPDFTRDELFKDLGDFLTKNVEDKRRPALATLKKDTQLITRMYGSDGNKEDSIDSPMSSLNLIFNLKSLNKFRSLISDKPELSKYIIAFALTEFMNSENLVSIPLNDLMYANDHTCSIGSIFRITENGLINKLEELSHEFPGEFQIRESSGINQFFMLKKIDSFKFLDINFKSFSKVA